MAQVNSIVRVGNEGFGSRSSSMALNHWHYLAPQRLWGLPKDLPHVKVRAEYRESSCHNIHLVPLQWLRWTRTLRSSGYRHIPSRKWGRSKWQPSYSRRGDDSAATGVRSLDSTGDLLVLTQISKTSFVGYRRLPQHSFRLCVVLCHATRHCHCSKIYSKAMSNDRPEP